MTNSKKILVLSFLLVGCMGRSAPAPAPSPNHAPAANNGSTMAGNMASFTLSMSAPSKMMMIGDSQALAVMATDAGSILNVTTDATLSSSDPTIATVSAQGEVTALAAGSVTIRAVLMDKDASVVLTVEPAAVVPPAVTLQSLRIDGPSSLPTGVIGHFTATAVYSDGSTMDVTGQATWSSQDSSVASAGANPGDVQAIAAGATTLVADFSTAEATASLTVSNAVLTSIAVSGGAPGPYAVPQLLAATGTYSDGSTQDLTATATFSSADPTVATIDASTAGQVDGVGPGSVVITAALGDISGTATLTFTNAQRTGLLVDNDASTPVVVGGAKWINTYYQYDDGTLQPAGAEAQWSSSDPSIATIGNGAEVGLASGVSVGTATLTVSAGGFIATTTITVNIM